METYIPFRGMASGMKRLVDLVDRTPRDDLFFPSSADNTIFRREFNAYHNAVPDIVEVGYMGNCSWGQRITVPLSREALGGDLLQWICLRVKPRTWLGADLEQKILSGDWAYQDAERAWMWAASLGTILIKEVQLEIGDTVVEKWGGEWMDIWSRMWIDGGRAATWDADIYGQIPPAVIRNLTNPPWTTVNATEDGYVYCWLPLAFLRRPTNAFPLIALGPQQEMRLHITLRPFREVIRRRLDPRTSPAEVPFGEVITLIDNTGVTPIPWQFKLPTKTPEFEEATVFAGLVHLDEPLRTAYMREPLEMMYDRINHMQYDIPKNAVSSITDDYGSALKTVTMQIPLDNLNGPIREICWFIRRKPVWRYNEWTNYGALLEDSLIEVANGEQTPLLVGARLMVDNAVWRTDSEKWWRLEYGMTHRGGVRLTKGMVYGFAFGAAADWVIEDEQPAGTINASRSTIRLDLEIAPQPIPDNFQECDGSEWEVHVFAVGINWMRFVNGTVGPLFKD